MDKIFLQILNMSVTASYVIVALVLIRLVLKKAPKIISYALWSIALFRLTLPFSFESIISLIPSSNVLPQEILMSSNPVISSGIPAIDQAVSLLVPMQGTSVNLMQTLVVIGSIIWIVGIVTLLGYSIISFVLLKRKVQVAIRLSDNIYECETVSSPFVLGIIKPKIYLPMGLSDTEINYILKHEQYHIKRFDTVIKPLGFLVLSVHWFNPLVWVAFKLMTKDMEMSCDESVIKHLGDNIKQDYSRTLLSFALPPKMINASPLAFGESGIKARIKNILDYKRPKFWIIVIIIITIVIVSVGLLSNPKKNEVKPDWTNDIYSYRTEFVGNNVKVLNISDRLNISQALEKTGIELQTKTAPYSLTINYKADTTTRDFFADENNQASIINSAVILFSLIENVDSVNFSIDDEKIEPYKVEYTRKWAEDLMGVNLWEQSSTLQGFVKQVDSFMQNLVENKALNSSSGDVLDKK